MPMRDRESITRALAIGTICISYPSDNILKAILFVLVGCVSVQGIAKDGRPVMYITFPPSNHPSLASPSYHEDFIRSCMYNFERVIYLYLGLTSSTKARNLARSRNNAKFFENDAMEDESVGLRAAFL